MPVSDPPAVTPPRLTGRDIVCVGFNDWDTEIWTNQHHLMHRLARENRVVFIESLGLRQPTLAGRDVRRLLRRLRRGLQGPRESDGVTVLSPLVIPLNRYRAVRWINRLLLVALVRMTLRRRAIRAPILWSYVPQAEGLIGALAPSLVVYHCVDDIAAGPGIDAASFTAAERRFAQRAELVLASAPTLAQRLRGWSANVVYAPNVADTRLFATALEPGAVDAGIAALARPCAVFIGAIVSSKLDFGLLVALARLRPAWSFALVGPIGLGAPGTDVSALAAEPNLHLLGPRSQVTLPAVLRGADAGIIPYARNRLTDSISPLKTYEYLAAGLPVVATPLPALAGLAEVGCAPDAAGLAALLDAALDESGPTARQARSRAAAANSWERRLEEIATWVASAERRGA